MRVVVVGGGLSGLFVASELVTAGIDVKVYEAAGLPGGTARSIVEEGYLLEPGVGTFNLPHPHLSPILERTGVEMVPARHASRRLLFVGGQLVDVSASPRLLAAPLLGPAAKLRMLGEPLVRVGTEPEETVAEFCRRRFGARGGGLLAAALATGVFAGDPERLSVEAAFPALTSLERAYGSLVVGGLRRRRRMEASLRPRSHVPSVGGLAAVCDAIAGQLGSRFVPDAAVTAVTSENGSWSVDVGESIEADVVVLAVRAEVAASLLTAPPHGLLSETVAAPVAVTWLGGTGDSPLPEAMGALVGPNEGLSTRGVLFESSYAPGRAPENGWLAKVIVGGTSDAGVVSLDDETLVSKTLAEVSLILGRRLMPDFTAVVRHLPGIPQYERGHPRWLSRLQQALSSAPGLYLTGWSYRGVGVSGLAADASRVAREIVALGRLRPAQGLPPPGDPPGGPPGASSGGPGGP